jgi:uncharacterized protein (DUF2132 family)
MTTKAKFFISYLRQSPWLTGKFHRAYVYATQRLDQEELPRRTFLAPRLELFDTKEAAVAFAELYSLKSFTVVDASTSAWTD